MQDNLLIQPQQVLIQVVLTPTGGTTTNVNPFAQQDFLTGRLIIGMQAYSASDMPNSPLAGNLPVIPDALFPYAFLNVSRSSLGPIKAGIWYKNVPLISLRHVYNPTLNIAGNLDMFWCDPMTIQWADTNIAFPTPRPQTDTYVVPILVTYLLGSQDPAPYSLMRLKR